ncbi:PLP-dependent transferase [Wilcoxina mikolae CBS 423.85]|nr:PLP-dependent transferase [Wilcoxina mikolae CBS 423.85]
MPRATALPPPTVQTPPHTPPPTSPHPPAHPQPSAATSLFLGPRGENTSILQSHLHQILSSVQQTRLNHYPTDDAFLTPTTPTTSSTFSKMQSELSTILPLLRSHSVPFFSPRYGAHMTSDPCLPSILGWFAGLLYNANNVSYEGGPVTTVLEREVGRMLCTRLGFDERSSWGHITSGGTVANLESICGERKLLDDLTTWELLNLRAETVLEMPQRVCDEFKVSRGWLQTVLERYSIQTVGREVIEREWGVDKPVQYLLGRTRHYSWPKGGAITSIGSANMVTIPVDLDGRMDMAALEQRLQEHLHNRQAIYAVVAVMGTTQEGAVDPLHEILSLRTKYQRLGLSFLVHADAAWGGYFACMTDPPNDSSRIRLSTWTLQQLIAMGRADSVTIDPHKSGFVPYPAGGLCYRDGRMRYLVTWKTPYTKCGVRTESIGIFGVEGSKPGAAAVATYMAHKVIGLDAMGYGALLAEGLFTCRRMAAHWATMSTATTPYIVVPLPRLPAEKARDDAAESGVPPSELSAFDSAIETQKQLIRDTILGQPNEVLLSSATAMSLLEQLGSDLNVNAFAANFRLSPTTVNDDIYAANFLNQRILSRLSAPPSGDIASRKKTMARAQRTSNPASVSWETPTSSFSATW